MKITGIIAEYDPFHRGHAWQLAEAKRRGADALLIVMSGNFVQRGGPAVTDKWRRTQMALAGGADAVLELPPAFACGSAEIFARGAVSQLIAAGCVDEIVFGASCDDIGKLSAAAELLAEEARLRPALQAALRSGLPYPAALAKAAEAEDPALAALLAEPNDLLGIEYLKAMKALGAPFSAAVIPRRGGTHGEMALPADGFASATAIRRALRDGAKPEDLAAFLPETTAAQLDYTVFADDLSAALSARLLALAAEGREALARYADVSDALAARILAQAPFAASFGEIVRQVTTRAFSEARVRRALLHILLEIRPEDQAKAPDALRLLGLRAASPLPACLKENAGLPLITKAADAPEALIAPYAAAQALYAQTVFFKTGRRLADEFRQSPVVL